MDVFRALTAYFTQNTADIVPTVFSELSRCSVIPKGLNKYQKISRTRTHSSTDLSDARPGNI